MEQLEPVSHRVRRVIATLAFRFTLVTVGIVAFLFLVIFVPLYSRLEDEVEQNFILDHTLKEQELESYFSYLIDIGLQVSTRTRARKMLILWNNESSRRKKASEELGRILEDAVQASPDFLHVIRLGKDGKPAARAGVPFPETGMFEEFTREIPAVPHIHLVYLSSEEPLLLVHSPVRDGQKRIGTDLLFFSPGPVRKILNEFQKGQPGYRAFIVSEKEGRPVPIFGSDRKDLKTIFPIPVSGDRGDTGPLDGSRYLYNMTDLSLKDHRLLTVASADQIFSTVRDLRNHLILVAILISAGGFFLSWRFFLPLGKRLVGETVRNIRMAEDLAAESERFRDSINFSPVPVVLTDEEGRILFLNRKFSDIFGYSKEEVPDLDSWWPLAYPDPDYRIEMREEWTKRIDRVVRYGEEFFPLEAEVRCRDGSFRTISFRFSFLKGLGMTVFYDITERKKMEAELHDLNQNLERRVEEEVTRREDQERLLIQQSRFAMMGEMISMIAHQWRQPLNTLGLILQDLPEAGREGELTEEYLDRMIDAAMKTVLQMSSTIDDFRNFFNPQRKKENFSLSESIQNSVSLIAPALRNNNIEISVDLREDVRVEGFANEFSQVMLNLLGNAKEAIQDGDPPKRRITILLEKKNPGKARILVCDTGEGIPEENLSRIFDPYFTTKEQAQGTGLGLYMARMIVEKNMGGKLTARNEKDGACFLIEL